jgi:hypothetical protein
LAERASGPEGELFDWLEDEQLGPADDGPWRGGTMEGLMWMIGILALVLIVGWAIMDYLRSSTSDDAHQVGGPTQHEPIAAGVLFAVAERPSTVIRNYRGRQQADAVAAFQAEAAEFSKFGYVPTSQSWAPGQWGCGTFLVAALLIVILVGIIVFIYMLIVKPDGTLTVVFTRQTSLQEPRTPAPPPEASRANLTARLEQLNAARSAGLITEEEYAKKRARLLEDL